MYCAGWIGTEGELGEDASCASFNRRTAAILDEDLGGVAGGRGEDAGFLWTGDVCRVASSPRLRSGSGSGKAEELSPSSSVVTSEEDDVPVETDLADANLL